MATAPEPDWFLRAVAVIGAIVGVVTLILTRRDKNRERSAAEKADVPTVRVQWNTQIDEQGWYTLKFGFRDIKRPIAFSEATVVRPRRAVITTWNGTVRGGEEGKAINPGWSFDAAPDQSSGYDAATAHLHLKTKAARGDRLEIDLSGYFRDGSLKPVNLRVAARYE